MNETWETCFGGLYEVSDTGRVRRSAPGSGTSVGRILAIRTDSRSGYPTVSLKAGGVGSTKYVHCLVAEAFIGPRPPGKQVNHKNGIKTDNRPANLEYVTPSENRYHAYAAGLQRRPLSFQGNAKLSDGAVREIRRRRADGEPLASLADAFGVTVSAVCAVANRRTWRDVA